MILRRLTARVAHVKRIEATSGRSKEPNNSGVTPKLPGGMEEPVRTDSEAGDPGHGITSSNCPFLRRERHRNAKER